jgi:NAD(P)H-hydrate epimerase
MVVGPGIGREEGSMEAVRSIISLSVRKSIPLVIDADAISALPVGKWPDGLIGVATPHSGEAERWLSGVAPLQALADCTKEESAIVITGHEDEIFGPGGRYCHATGGHPRMAVSGTGDLLAGTIGGLLAQGMAPWPAARLACAVLREAGSKAAQEKGPGLLADDVPVHIAHTLSEWVGVR